MSAEPEIKTPKHMYDASGGPLVWPVCSNPECHITYILRRGFSIGSGAGWFWYRDCKHKSAHAEMHTAEGVLP